MFCMDEKKVNHIWSNCGSDALRTNKADHFLLTKRLHGITEHL